MDYFKHRKHLLTRSGRSKKENQDLIQILWECKRTYFLMGKFPSFIDVRYHVHTDGGMVLLIHINTKIGHIN